MSKLIINNILLALFVTFGIQKCGAQRRSTSALPEILINAGNKGLDYNKLIRNYNVKIVSFVNDRQFLDEKKEFAFNPDHLREQIQLAYSDPKAKGMAYIDLEHPYMEYLIYEDIKSEKFQKSLKLFLDVLKFVKTERPNVKWGYYGIPFTSYWERTPDFFNRHKKIQELIKNSDVLFPSIYIFYDKTNFNAENVDYLKDNTREMIRIGKLYNKKTYPFIMSRYHPSNEKLGNESIDIIKFKTYVSQLMKTQYNGKKVDGVVLWNADEYSYRIQEPKLIKELNKSRASFDTFYNNYINSYLDIMKKER
ncbi:hypothetical protein P2W68_11010 [Chryseobacterium arthrosphaerae]|uniref:hypothetical protein n=1 Tax=Chryseobacterium arthrosphaerae TaxID=651561 RepID=UPI0023E175AD|nr:hypothetical protein [Chryseobacterium arthrosphaerae]WET00141.1 hypothetical protein P2W68_11010 [Chryseobacterium arthrosphaerae]